MLYERFLEILKGLSFKPTLNEDDEYLHQPSISISIVAEKDRLAQIVKYHFDKVSKNCIGCEVI